MLERISSKYILQKVINGHLNNKRYLQLVQYNKKLQKNLEISIKDYIKFYNRIIIELTPKLFLNESRNYFIRIKDKESSFFHIFFGENISEEKRAYITSEDKIKKIKIIIDSKIKSFTKLFYNCTCLESINILRCTRKDIKSMYSTFYGCSSLINIDLSKLKTDSVEIMRDMFYNCSNLKEINLNNFNTKNVRTMQGMFSDCTSLINLYIDNFDTSEVESMNDMFFKCINLKSLNMSNFNTEKVTNMSYMFYHCDSLINLDITKFKLDNAIKMNYMFSGCKKELQALVKNQNSGFKDSAFIKSYY